MLEQPTFGQRLKALRLERGMSQAALAGDEISTGYLSRLESGERRPTPRVVRYVSERLNVSPKAFEQVQDGHGMARLLAAISSAGGEDVSEELMEALASDEGSSPALQWQAGWLLAKARSAQGRYEDEYSLLIDLAALADQLAVPELRARTYTELSRCARILGHNDSARDYAAEAVETSANLGPSDRTAALHALISAEAEAGRLLEARGHADQLVALAESMGGTAYTTALWASATVFMRQGEPDSARKALEIALERLSSHEDLVLWMRLRLAAASLYLQITPAESALARARLNEVEPVVNLIGSDRNQQELLSLRAHLAFDAGDYEQARALVDQVEQAGAQLSFRDGLRLRALKHMLAILDGRAEEGVRELQRLGQEAYDEHNIELAAEIWRNLAGTLAQLRDENG